MADISDLLYGSNSNLTQGSLPIDRLVPTHNPLSYYGYYDGIGAPITGSNSKGNYISYTVGNPIFENTLNNYESKIKEAFWRNPYNVEIKDGKVYDKFGNSGSASQETIDAYNQIQAQKAQQEQDTANLTQNRYNDSFDQNIRKPVQSYYNRGLFSEISPDKGQLKQTFNTGQTDLNDRIKMNKFKQKQQGLQALKTGYDMFNTENVASSIKPSYNNGRVTPRTSYYRTM